MNNPITYYEVFEMVQKEIVKQTDLYFKHKQEEFDKYMNQRLEELKYQNRS